MSTDKRKEVDRKSKYSQTKMAIWDLPEEFQSSVGVNLTNG